MSQTPTDAPDAGSDVFVVGDLRVDIGQQRIMRAATEIVLPNLSFQLLEALIRGAPNVVSYDMLMARVWPGLVVSPETLNKRAILLREALGDDAKEPRYISSVRSRGYRLVADVTRLERPAPLPTAPSPNVSAPPDTEPSTRRTDTSEAQAVPAKQGLRWWLVVPAVAVAALAVGFLARTYMKDHSPVSGSATEKPEAADTPIITRARTVAVLPFDNISAGATDAYLARGLPEMLIDRLSHVSGLTVIARTSSFALTTGSIDSQDIGRRLNAGFLVNGSVQRRADRLRVAVRLVETTAGTLIWSATLDRTLSDIFTVEDEIADQVTGALSARLGGLEPKPLAQVRSSNIEAYLAYLRGRSLVGRLSVADADAAARLFETAIALDPKFAAAYASLYDARLQAAVLRYEDLAPARRHFRPLIDQALAIDPDTGSAYFARAAWADAPLAVRNADFLRGVALDPSNGRGLAAYASFLGSEMQRPREAARMQYRASQVDPMSPGDRLGDAWAGLDVGGAAMVERNMQAVLELDPELVPALHQVGLYRWLFHGKLADAVQILEHAIALDPNNPWLRHTAMAVYVDLGDEQAARAVAAGTPQSARSVSLLSLYSGDWRDAGRAAYDDVRWSADCQNWLEPQALRDYALKTGQFGRAVAFIKVNYYMENDPATELDVCSVHAAVVLSQLQAAQGHTAEAQALRRAAMSWADANTEKYAGGPRRIAAEVLLLGAQRDAALDKLAEDFRFGDYQFWAYTLKYDPLWLPLHGDPRFQAIATDVQRYVDAQRSQLEEMRRRGTVPPAARAGESAQKPEVR